MALDVGKDQLEALHAWFSQDKEQEQEPLSAWERYKAGWRPRLNPTQENGRKSKAKFKLYHGERGGAKTTGGLHELVEHCFLNKNALAIIIVGVKRQAEEGGAWYKLQQEVLPTWKYGNRETDHGRFTGKMFDDGIGLEYTEPRTNTAKDCYLWIKNKHAGGSRVLLLSMPVDSFVMDRVKGMEPSFVLVDEAQTLESDTYFRGIVQQVGRRPGIETKQQIIYCANPDGPSHWLYKRFWVMPVNEKTGEWDEKYARFHFPIKENIHNLPEGYWENVLEATRGDPVEEARMVRGEWIDRPTGKAMFRDDFRPSIHMRGDAANKRGIAPSKGHPIILSYDLGAAHTSITFEQVIPTLAKTYKVIFDELDFVGQYIRYSDLVPLIIGRMAYWDVFENDGEKVGPFHFIHISDDSAFNQYRAATGSYDAWDIEQLSQAHVELRKLDKKYVIRLLACPKGPGSIAARVRLLKDALQREECLIAATCRHVIDMLNNIEEDDKEPLNPRRSPHLHRFDSSTYGFFYYATKPGRFQVQTAPVETGGAFVMGSG